MNYSVMRRKVQDISEKIADRSVRQMYLNCFYNTLDTTTEILPDSTTFIFTGDIPAMWLRDSSVQVTGYLPYAKEDDDVRRLIKGLLARQFKFILLDPYANAFNVVPHKDRHIDDTGYECEYVWERKYEVDSLCYPLWLSLEYYEVTGDKSIFSDEFFKAFDLTLKTFITEQNHDRDSKYYFKRTGYWADDTLENNGKGAPSAPCGLIWSAFRPSDDRCKYHYLIPANQMAVVVFEKFADIFKSVVENRDLYNRSIKIASEIRNGIEKFGIINHPEFGKIYAYEVDGYGNHLLMDDANVPSLLSLPYLGYCAPDDEIYRNTRAFVLSHANPYYFEGKFAKGIGSPHTPINHIWHISIVIQMLTSIDKTEIKECFNMLLNTDGGTEYMHESFDKDDPRKYTRGWFAWANTLFGIAVERILKLMDIDDFLRLYGGKDDRQRKIFNSASK